MASSLATRNFFKQLAMLVEMPVKVTTSLNKTYLGVLKGYDPASLSVCLVDTKDEKGTPFDNIFIMGRYMIDLMLAEKPFDLNGLTLEIGKLFPPGEVKYDEEARVITVLNKVKVTEKGVEGTGPIAERVQKIYEKYVEEHGKIEG